MSPSRTSAVVVGSLAALAQLSVASAALATSTQAPGPPSCPVVFAPAAALTEDDPLSRIPANAPAIAVVPREATNLVPVNMTPDDLRGFTVVPDPASPESMLILPSTPFEAGVRYELALRFQCETYKDQTLLAFDSSKEVPLPTRVGTLAAQPPTYGHATLLLTPTDELAAFLPVTRFEIRLRGGVWSTLPYGQAVLGDRKVSLEIANLGGEGNRTELCAVGEVGIRPLDVEVRAHVAGATTDPEPTTIGTAAIDCTRPAHYDRDPTSSAADDGGCSAASGSSSRAAGGGALVALVVGVAGLGRRRRYRGGR